MLPLSCMPGFWRTRSRLLGLSRPAPGPPWETLAAMPVMLPNGALFKGGFWALVRNLGSI